MSRARHHRQTFIPNILYIGEYDITVVSVMEKKYAFGAIACMLILVLAVAGCGGDDGGGGGGGSGQEDLVPVTGSVEDISGWAEANNQLADVKVDIQIPQGNLAEVVITVEVQDTDAEHQDQDGTASNDEIDIKISGGDQKADFKGTTPVSSTFKFPMAGGNASAGGEEGENSFNLSQSWSVSIKGTCNSGAAPLAGFVIVYVDVGIAYTVKCSYTYMASATGEVAAEEAG